MIRIAKITTVQIAGIIILSACNNNKDNSAFGEILSSPPYATLTDSIEKNPNDDGLYFRRAVMLNKDNLPEPALADFRKAWTLKKEEKYALGVSTILLERIPDSAIIFLNEAIGHLPKSSLLGLSLARAYVAQGRITEAFEIVDALVKQNPEQVDVLKLKADLLDKKGERLEAVRTLEKAYWLTPFDIELNHMLAFQYAETKNPKLIRLCDSLINMDSLGLHADPYYYKGIYYANLSDKTKALAQFEEAIRHDYNFLDAHIEKGIVLFEQKRYYDAFQAFNLAMTISPKYGLAYYWMAKSMEGLGQVQEARVNYQRAYGLDKTLTEAKEAADRLARQ